MSKISESIFKFLHLDNLVQHLNNYVEARIELIKVEIREDLSKVVAGGLMIITLFFIGFLFLIFFSVGLAYFLNQFFEGPYGGYWSVAAIYGATFLLLLVFKRNIYNYCERQFSELIKRKEK